MMKEIKIQLFKGSEILPYLAYIAKFRSTIFREYPYLYESKAKFEEEYVRNYAKSKNSLFIIAKDQDRVIGCLTSTAAIDVLHEVWAEALRAIPVDSLFYLGDLLILKEYRNQRLGTKMYDLFEKTVREGKKYSQITFHEIVRPKDDPKRPKQYHSLDPFWEKRGYVKHPELISHVPYREIGDSAETPHIMVYWIKNLTL